MRFLTLTITTEKLCFMLKNASFFSQQGVKNQIKNRLMQRYNMQYIIKFII